MLQLPSVYGYYPPPNRTRLAIVLLGCGGTGGYVAPALARLAYALNRFIQDRITPSESFPFPHLRRCDLVFIDGDHVTEANLLRQHFVPAELGANKAEALALRYSLAFGIPVRAVPEYIDAGSLSQLIPSSEHLVILVTCVDNHATRADVHKCLLDNPDLAHYCIWIDAGNELSAGHVVCGHEPAREFSFYPENHTTTILPYVTRIFPEILERRDRHPLEMSCAELAVSQPQIMATNQTAATIITNFLYTLLLYPPLKAHAVFFNILSNTYETRLNTLDNLLSYWRGCSDPAQPGQINPTPPPVCLSLHTDPDLGSVVV